MILVLILILFIILMIVYFFKGQKKIKKYIEYIFILKKGEITKKANKQKIINFRNIKKTKIKKKRDIKSNPIKKINIINQSNNKIINIKNSYSIYASNVAGVSNTNKINNTSIIKFNKNRHTKIQGNKIKKINKNNNTSSPNIIKVNKISNIIIKKINDYELNNLNYKEAIILDQRTFFNFYISLIRRKHLILFSFIPMDDYNLMTIKISHFLISFSTYFAINGFFFNDKTMHQIYKDKSSYNIIEQISIIIYSSIISTTINLLLRQLCLSERDILSIKKIDNLKDIVKKLKDVQKNLIIKFIIYYILGFLLLFFFWFFISCFCVVFINTQIILIKDTLISFGLSMLYPFGLNLLPGMLRIPALRAKKQDKKCIYQISGIVALI